MEFTKLDLTLSFIAVLYFVVSTVVLSRMCSVFDTKRALNIAFYCCLLVVLISKGIVLLLIVFTNQNIGETLISFFVAVPESIALFVFLYVCACFLINFSEGVVKIGEDLELLGGSSV